MSQSEENVPYLDSIRDLHLQGRCSQLSYPILPEYKGSIWRVCHRYLSDANPQDLTEGEKKILNILKAKFPGQTYVDVADISGGCGSMYEVSIEAEEFRGMRTVKQHMMVNEALKTEIKEMHGLRINTKVPR